MLSANKKTEPLVIVTLLLLPLLTLLPACTAFEEVATGTDAENVSVFFEEPTVSSQHSLEESTPLINADETQSRNEENILNGAITITIDGRSFSVSLEDNETARAFSALLPMSTDMGDLNGNEKYVYLDNSLPTEASAPGRIEAGDLMLYGSNCVVLFYEAFDSSFSYTRLGHVDDPAALEFLSTATNVNTTFERM